MKGVLGLQEHEGRLVPQVGLLVHRTMKGVTTERAHKLLLLASGMSTVMENILARSSTSITSSFLCSLYSKHV